MAVDYSALSETARRIIGENGAMVRLVQAAGGQQYDPVTNSYTSTNETYDGLAIITSFSERYINGTTIKAGDRRVIASLPVEPAIGSKLEVYSKSGLMIGAYQVVNVTPVRPNGEVVVVYQLQCRE